MFLEIDKKNAIDIALVDDTNKKITYGDITAYVDELKTFLDNRTLAFILCSNTAGAVLNFIACIENKIVPLLIKEDLDRELLNNLLNTYKPQYLILPNNMINEFLNYRIVYEAHDYSILSTCYEKYALNDELSLLLMTSGTTGSPKLVRHSYKNINFSYKNVAEFFGFIKDDVGLADLPMHYTMGLSVICSHLYAGTKVILTNHNLMSKEYWKLFDLHRITTFTGVPFSYEILDKLRFFRKTYPSLRILAEGGGRLNDGLFEKIAVYAKENNIHFFATFGATETTARLAFLNPDLAIEKIGSIGKEMPNGKLMLRDNIGNVINEMEAEGELVYKGDNVTMGYALNIDDLRKGDERQGLYVTGDIAKRDKDGCYYIIGRKSRFLKLYGLRVSLDQCENLIREEFKIDCACVGNDKKMKVYLEDDSFADNVVELLSKKIKLPINTFCAIFVDEIPRNTSGKIMYSRLE